MAIPYYDFIVVGCGGIGSGALYWLTRQGGNRVLGLEQFKLGHENGGSHDYSRNIRMDYTDDAYIDLCRGAYSSWNEVERESGVRLVYKTGGVDFTDGSPSADRYLCDIEEAMNRHGVRCERMDGDLLSKRFPQFVTKSNCRAIYLPDNGVINSAHANAVHIQLARKHGAHILEEVKVTGINREEGVPLVQTTHGNFRCRRVIVTAGAWANDVLESVGVKVPLRVTQEQVTYFDTPHRKDFTKDRFPCWTYMSSDGDVFYGLPVHAVKGPKVAMDAAGAEVTPQTRSFTPNQENIDKCIRMCREYIPRCLGPILMTKTCLYAMTRDRHFVIDTCHRSGFPDVIVCYGAGHAFK
ncbi:monomeric sarcosine oxidase-like [Patiria miniata]|uniref:FAD dependent oxidoreductase domain-containing protein n=1 Tax=Patiria miniata TaxID=46514 RepID=A0A914AF18_PATMI|nr:monomeric sarcosine oxidase-like [Patiria miniata]